MKTASAPHGTRRSVLALAVFLAVCPCCATAGRGADLHYSVSWIGNSFSGKTAWIQQDVEGLWVEPDGTLFTNVRWDEAGGNVQQYRDGQLIAMARHTHGWGYEGGEALATNSKYLFIVQNVSNEGGGLRGNSWPPKGFTWSGISRRHRSDITRAAPFPGGHGKEGDVLQGAFLPVAEFAEDGRSRVRGLWATETELLVSSPLDDTTKVYDAAKYATASLVESRTAGPVVPRSSKPGLGPAKAAGRRNTDGLGSPSYGNTDGLGSPSYGKMEGPAFHAQWSTVAPGDRIPGRRRAHGDGR